MMVTAILGPGHRLKLWPASIHDVDCYQSLMYTFGLCHLALFPDTSRHYLGNTTGQSPLTKTSTYKFACAGFFSVPQSSNTIPTVFVLSKLPDVLIPHIKGCKRIINFGLKSHQSARLQRNTLFHEL